MKEFVKMSKTELAVFILMSIASGLVIGIGATASLLANVEIENWGRLIGAALFTVGIYAIVMYEMRLFTGMVASIPKMGLKNTWKLPVCFLGNVLGVSIVAGLVYFTPLKDSILPKAQEIAEGKLTQDLWYIKSFCSSILCGILITASVRSRHYATQKRLSVTLGVVFPIIVFAFCGFDHSVANMLHFFYLGECSWRVVGYILMSILGNLIGGVTFPIVTLIRKQTERDRAEKANETPNYVDD
jgi:formate/nitrite transporter FocA (FNT family)